ncbi:type VI secretion system tip protein TssI/VgrG [Vibrio spartinae]|uniref:Type VI secretion system Vgr family protein n=1 Tax=Vibrio spartinae TaxID=1918945 RepID=A0ABX6QUP8_9VIBR|nr:type VI secretion system tip protein TssI/VgrG [Vibrio spartinae]QMV12832.1 type VI secretion system Vgr family protein [Vibrio spartinae]
MGTLNFRLVSGVGEALVVRDYQGHESVSDSLDAQGNPVYGFRYQIELASRNSSISAEQLVDTTAVLEVIRDGEVVQQVHGIVRSFSRGDTGHHHTYYALTLVPALERLSLRHNSRIFQHKTVPEILANLLDEMNITDYAFSVKRECAPREFCVQYRETDLAFFHRLAAEEGLMYTFSHQAEKHTLVVTDNTAGFTQLDGTVPYNVLSGGVADTPYVSAISETKQSAVTEVAMRDYSFKKPAYNFKQSALGSEMAYQLPDYEYYDAPGRYKDDASGKAFSQIRLEHLRRNSHTASGKSNQAKLQAGVVFTLADHLDSAMNRPWLIVGIDHQGSQPQALEESGGSGATTYSNQFTVIPNETLWRMQPHPKPQVDGPMVATVVGPQGEEIYCDEHGRVKLSFPWDRYSNEDEHSSCWVRVAQGWAGAQYGMVAIPRIGHEVIVTFLNGDPDQPLVSGRTYHATNTPPYSLPDNKTKTVIRTQTHQGTGFNEFSFEDQSGSEKIYLHAQKDYEALVENDSTTQLKHDRHLTVENDRYSHVQVNDHLSIDGEQRTAIKQNLTLAIDASLHQKVGQKTIVDSGSEVHLKAGNAVVLDAGNEITVKVGGSFIKVDAGGVHVVSGAINLNSGGSAGSGSGYGGQPATMPNLLKALTPPAEAQAPAFTASETAMSPLLKAAEAKTIANPVLQEAQIKALTGNEPVCEVCEAAEQLRAATALSAKNTGGNDGKSRTLNQTTVENDEDREFKVTDIPAVMKDKLNWPKSAAVMKLWFGLPAREMAQDEKTGVIKPINFPEKYINKTLFPWEWLAMFPRVQDALKTISERLDTPNAQRIQRDKIKKLISRQPELKFPHELDNDPDPLSLHPDWQFQLASIGYDFGEVDDLYGSLGNFAIYAAITKACIEQITEKRYQVTVTEVGLYMRDTFDFIGNQYLGHWDFEGMGLNPVGGMLNSVNMEWHLPGWNLQLGIAKAFGNQDFNRYRKQSGKGGDLLLFSDIKCLPVSIKLTMEMM